MRPQSFSLKQKFIGLLFLSTFLTVVSAFGRGGTFNGGGGGTFIKVLNSELLISWDLLESNPNFRETIVGDQISKSSDLSQGQWIDYRNFKSFLYLKERMLKWQQRMPHFFQYVNEDDFLMLDGKTVNLLLVGTHLSLHKLEEISVSKHINAKDFLPVPVAHFDEGRERIYVQIDNWNRAGLISQSALLLHERLRGLQKRTHLPNEILQRMVALIFLQDPQDVTNLPISDESFAIPFAPDNSLLFWVGPGTFPAFQRTILSQAWDGQLNWMLDENLLIKDATKEVEIARQLGFLKEGSSPRLILESQGRYNPLPNVAGEYLLEPASCQKVVRELSNPKYQNTFRWGFECVQDFLRGVGELRFESKLQDDLKIQVEVNLLGSSDGGSQFELRLFDDAVRLWLREDGRLGLPQTSSGFHQFIVVVSRSRGVAELYLNDTGDWETRKPLLRKVLPHHLRQKTQIRWSYVSFNHVLVRTIQVLK